MEFHILLLKLVRIFDYGQIHTKDFEGKSALTAITFADEKGKQKKVTRVNFLTNLSFKGTVVTLQRGTHSLYFSAILNYLRYSWLIPDVCDLWDHNYHHVDNISKTLNKYAPPYPKFSNKK